MQGRQEISRRSFNMSMQEIMKSLGSPHLVQNVTSRCDPSVFPPIGNLAIVSCNHTKTSLRPRPAHGLRQAASTMQQHFKSLQMRRYAWETYEHLTRECLHGTGKPRDFSLMLKISCVEDREYKEEQILQMHLHRTSNFAICMHIVTSTGVALANDDPYKNQHCSSFQCSRPSAIGSSSEQ
jgi:hypothetical protein